MFKFYNDIIHHMPKKFNENRSIAHQTRVALQYILDSEEKKV